MKLFWLGLLKKVLLIGPFKNSELRVGQFFAPPYGIHRIASFLNSEKIADVEVFDPDLSGVELLFEKVKSAHFDIIGFSMLYYTLPNDIGLACEINKLSPESILIAGGQGAAFCEEFILKETPIRAVLKGFGEFPMAELIESFAEGKPDFSKVSGISFRQGMQIGNNLRRLYTNEDFRRISAAFDFSAIPYEKYWEVMEKKYSREELKVMKNDGLVRTIRIMTSSHCPMKCSFCSSTNFLDDATGQIQCSLKTSVDEIMGMLESAVKAHPGVEAFFFNDDDLLQDSKRAEELCKRIISRFSGSGISFFCLSRIDKVSHELFALLKKANFKLIIFGVESFSNKLLAEMNKRIASPNPAKKSFKTIKESLAAGITPLMNTILFYPTTTIEDIILTVESAVELVEAGARLTVYSFVEAYPGASLIKEPGLEFESKSFEGSSGREIKLPWIVLPKDRQVKELALLAVQLRERLAENLKKKHGLRAIPHPAYSLLLFKAVYSLIGKKNERMDFLIEKMALDARAGFLEVFA